MSDEEPKKINYTFATEDESDLDSIMESAKADLFAGILDEDEVAVDVKSPMEMIKLDEDVLGEGEEVLKSLTIKDIEAIPLPPLGQVDLDLIDTINTYALNYFERMGELGVKDTDVPNVAVNKYNTLARQKPKRNRKEWLSLVEAVGSAIHAQNSKHENIRAEAGTHLELIIQMFHNTTDEDIRDAIREMFDPLNSNPKARFTKVFAGLGDTLKDQDAETIKKALDENAANIQFLPNPTEAQQVQAVKADPSTIRFIKKQAPAAQMIVATDSRVASNFLHVKNPSDEIVDAALDTDGMALRYVDKMTHARKVRAITKSGCAIKFVNDPIDELKVLAVQSDPMALEFVENPTDQTIDDAIAANPMAILTLVGRRDMRGSDKVADGHLTHDRLLRAFQADPTLMKKFDPIPTEVQMAMVKIDRNNIFHMDRTVLSKKVVDHLVTEDDTFLDELKAKGTVKPDYKVTVAIVASDVPLTNVKETIAFLQQMDKPSEEIIDFVYQHITDPKDAIKCIRNTKKPETRKYLMEKFRNTFK